jgi:hypothetical protein
LVWAGTVDCYAQRRNPRYHPPQRFAERFLPENRYQLANWPLRDFRHSLEMLGDIRLRFETNLSLPP